VDPAADDAPPAPPGVPPVGQAKAPLRGKGSAAATPAELAGEIRTQLGPVGEVRKLELKFGCHHLEARS